MTTTSTLLAVALLGAGFWGWRLQLERQRARFIATFGFPQRLRSKLSERYPHLSAEQVSQVLHGLREYFQLCRLAKRQLVAMPSQAVDVAWHEFILYTRQYQGFCRRALGRFLHHTPNDAMPSQRAASEGIRRAWRLSCARENLARQAPQRLPLLFALDAELGIADGFHYSLNCGALPGSYRQGDAYCASHIGCSSGCGGGSSCGGGGDGSAGGSSDSSSGSSDGGGCGGGCGGGD
ncbi:hypothetical protein A9179_21205 [Pseudomonas alcaligenes]|uniref:Uncharacterized protein n=1 Tax=Aquipseudomonas alcaligenes TaxID=43263 RepID=A0ABR7S5D5_AQUAC|nr:hypothetical protein [Pseudomonas alcaligenes]MBC9252791.1 hypothetical protein [Pseudomonas alcaligenes]